MKSKIKKVLLVASALIGLAVFLFYFSVRLPIPGIKSSEVKIEKRVQHSNEYFTLGKNYLKKNKHGVWELYIEGKPYERGLAYGMLCKELMEKQEAAFVDQVNLFVPNKTYLFFLKLMVAWFNRNITEHIPVENLEEIYGVSQSFSNRFDYIAPKYYRILNYHAAHDIGHALKEYSLVGCTSFSVRDSFSSTGNLVVGRNFDFYMGDKFAEDKLILIIKPDSGYKFISYSWAGFTGVVSGMNEKGITVTINAAKSTLPTSAKTPVALLAREILQYASSLNEAVEIAKKRKLFVSESLLIGSGPGNNSIIIEKSPDKMDVVVQDGPVLVCSNHFQGKSFQMDSINVSNIRNSDSQYRYDRTLELLYKKAPLNIDSAISVLRDRKGLAGRDIGLGNPKSINQLIAHHAVVFDPVNRNAWFSTPPFQEGNFIRYSLQDNTLGNNFSESDSMDRPADEFINTKEFSNYMQYHSIRQQVNRFILFDIPYTLDNDDRFIALNPNSYTTYLTVGDYYAKQKKYDSAVYYYSIALQKDVASNEEANSIRKKLDECKGKIK